MLYKKKHDTIILTKLLQMTFGAFYQTFSPKIFESLLKRNRALKEGFYGMQLQHFHVYPLVLNEIILNILLSY